MKRLRERLLEQVADGQAEYADPAALRDHYQSVLDSVGSVVYTVNRELHITSVNQQWDNFALTNGDDHLTSAHILGSHLLEQMQGAPLQRWHSVCRRILNGQLSRYLDEVASQESYEWRHYSLSATPLRDGQGEILGITFVATNITQLKKAEHEMFQRLVEIRGLQQVAQITGGWADRRKVYKQVTADVAHLFGAEKCVIFLWDEETGNLQAQEPAYGLGGRRLAELALDMGHPADPESLWLDLEEKDYILLNEGDDAPADMRETSARVDRLAAMFGILRVSGRIHGAILVAGRDQTFSDQDGQLLALFAVPTALSIENTNLNRRLLDRTQQLSTVRHELDRLFKMQEAIRMPLSVIQGYLELILNGAMGPVPNGQRPMMQIALSKTQAVASIINRISPQRFPADANRLERIYLADLMRRVVEQYLVALEQAGLDLVTRLPPPRDAESSTLGDPDMLSKVFDALMDTAIKHSSAGGALTISLQVSGETLHVELATSGVGIPADELLGIWKPGKHAQATERKDLAEVKRIVEGHAGQVWAESAPGEGSTFHIILRRMEHQRVQEL